MTSDLNPYHTSDTTSSTSVPSPSQGRRQLLPIAVSILVLSILHITFGLFYFVFVYSSIQRSDALDPYYVQGSIVNCLYYGITMIYSLVLISGAFSMMRQGSYLWAMTVCVLSLIPILGPCYVFAIPIGIWGIVVLRRPEVRDSFAPR